MGNPVEEWKSQKHGFDIWPSVLEYARTQTPMKKIDTPDLERMKWHGVFYRKNDGVGTYMLRIRLTGCELTSEQARAIAMVAYQFGYGIVDLTTRANIQVQGLSIENVPKALERLQATGLSCKQTGHDNIRNVFCHPFSGLDPEELIDTRDLCRQISDLFIDSRVYSDLPRKFNIALSGREDHGLSYWSQDLSFLATRSTAGDVLFQMMIAGTQGQNPHLGWNLPILARPEQAVAITKALLDLFRAKGSREKRDRARFRYLVEQIGVIGVLEHLEKTLPFPLQPNVKEPVPVGSYDEFVGWFRQKQKGRWILGLCVPVGRLSWKQLEGLAVSAAKWGSGSLRVTHEQGIALVDIPTGFKDAVATDAAALGLSHLGDSVTMNTVACTGKQFCNIAVTETKGHALRLIEQLRTRALALHGVRIHMSGCPSSCAQHFTADIGLKGVRVRRLLGTREGFDVYLGGGIAGRVHLGIPYKLGVDVDQLPELVEQVVREYYMRHRSGETFSMYWREKLRDKEAIKVGDGEYSPPIWICEKCDNRSFGEDPPVFCPRCSALRRFFARVDGPESGPRPVADVAPPVQPPSDGPAGYAFACPADAIVEGQASAVNIAGKEIALYRVNGAIHAIADACPHEGAPLSQGDIVNGVVTCPWHAWTYDACSGCGVSHPETAVAKYATIVQDGKVYVQAGDKSTSGVPSPVKPPQSASPPPAPKVANLTVIEILDETPDTKTFRLANEVGLVPVHLPGQFAKVSFPVAGANVSRSFTISSSPTQKGRLDLTIKLNPTGQLSRALFDRLEVGAQLALKAPLGAFYFDLEKQTESLVLIAAGSGITPMMAILRYLRDVRPDRPVTLIYGCRTQEDIIFRAELVELTSVLKNFNYVPTLSRPSPGWLGRTGRVDFSLVLETAPDIKSSRYFLCGPSAMMESLVAKLKTADVPADRIHTEEFHTSTPGKALVSA